MTMLFIKFVAISFFVFSCMNFVHSFTFNTVVSLDGTGNFRSISAAIAAVPSNRKSRFYIHVKPGIYKEHVEIEKQKTFIALIGDNAANTVIVDDRSHATGFNTFESATFVVKGDNFMAQSITFENSAGPENGQAVALFNNHANHTVYYKCVFLGYQDTLYVNGDSIFFKDSEIYGTVDFIFGYGQAVYQDCNIYARLGNRTITITAQSKRAWNQRSGFVFQNCTVLVSPELRSIENLNFEVYLGRPWRDYSTVIFMDSFLDYLVNPVGWLAWSAERPLNLLFYAEYNNKGPGAYLTSRVKWPGFHAINSPSEVINYTVNIFIDGYAWLPETGVPFRPTL